MGRGSLRGMTLKEALALSQRNRAAWTTPAAAAQPPTPGRSATPSEKASRKLGEIFACEDCGAPVTRNGAMQRFCTACSDRRALKRKREWAARNPPDLEAKRVSRERREARLRAIAPYRNPGRGPDWFWEQPRPLAWRVYVSVPFTWTWSKNAIWSLGNRAEGSHLFIRKEHNQLREMLGLLVNAELRAQGIQVVDHTVWLDALVQKPSHRGDAINVLDGIADALKVAVGVDDRWFAIRRLDWEVVKANPMIYIGIGQEVTQHHRICSYCGRCLPLTIEHFGARKHDPRGFARVCRLCARIDDGLRPVRSP